MTTRVHRATTWPLLRKDLTEMAAQPRAYWLRMLCVAVLSACSSYLDEIVSHVMRTPV